MDVPTGQVTRGGDDAESTHALTRSEQRLRVAIAAARLGDWDWDAATDAVQLSLTAASMFGMDEVRPITWTEMRERLLLPEDAEAASQAVEQAIKTGADYSAEYRVRRGDQIAWLAAHGRLTLLDGKPTGLIGVVRDITDEKLAHEALEDQRRTLETLNRTGAALAGEFDLQKVVQTVTDAAVEVIGAKFGAFFYNVLNERGEAYLLYTLSGAKRSDFEDFGMPRATAVFHPTFAGEGTIRSDDITKDERYGKNDPHHGMPEGHLPVRSYLAVPVISRSGEVLGGLFFGHPEPSRFTDAHERLMLGLASQAAVSIDNARLYQAVQRANETLEQRVNERTSELETANEALRQAQKMEAIGQLTGGIAHDFNNMLTVIRGSTDVLRRQDLEESKRERYLDAIADTADRAARLTAQLLAFARRQALMPQVFDAAERVRGIAEMLRTVLGSRIRLNIDSECEDCFVEADPSQFETAVVNMAVNARDAMSGEGELSIRIGKVESLPANIRPETDREFVAVAVRDTGQGIPAEELDKIFEPFFTTKEVGKGTGLGLSQVYGFAKQSGGEIGVVSDEGQGATFTLYLPREDAALQAEPESRRGVDHIEGGGRVLVVEDNSEVGDFAEHVLAELGFDATLATNGAEALAKLEEGHSFDVVFSDVVMPVMSGVELARTIRSRWPDLPVVLTSGYAHILAAEHGHGFPLLHKPYSLDALGRAIHQALRK